MLDRRDHLVWKPSKKGIFSTKSCYDAILSRSEITYFPCRKIWNLSIPSKVSLWNAYMDKIFSLDNLQSRG